MESNGNEATEVGSSSDEAQERKECLEKLESPLDNGNQSKTKKFDFAKLLPKPEIRSYAPVGLKIKVMPAPQVCDIIDEVDEDHVEKSFFTDRPIARNTSEYKRTVLDFKADIQYKMALLEKRTQRAISKLICKRLEEDKNIDFLTALDEGINGNLQIGDLV